MRNSLSARIEAWTILQSNLKPQVEEVPHLASELANLERLLLEGKTLEEARTEHLRAIGARSRERKMVILEGDALFKRLTLALRAQYGPQSEKLFKYGVTPEKPRRRRALGAGVEEPPVIEAKPRS